MLAQHVRWAGWAREVPAAPVAHEPRRVAASVATVAGGPGRHPAECGVPHAAALLFRAVIDEAIIPRNAGRLLVLMGLLGGLIVLHLLGEIAREYFAARAAARLLAPLRLRTFEHLQR